MKSLYVSGIDVRILFTIVVFPWRYFGQFHEEKEKSLNYKFNAYIYILLSLTIYNIILVIFYTSIRRNINLYNI